MNEQTWLDDPTNFARQTDNDPPMTQEPESQERWEKLPDDGSWLVAGEGGGSIKARCFIEFDADHIVALHNARLAPQDATDFRLWHASGNRIWRVSINGDLPGGEDEFPCLNEGVAESLAEQLNDEGRTLYSKLNSLTAKLREAEQERDSQRAIRRAVADRDAGHVWRQRATTAEARVTALAAAWEEAIGLVERNLQRIIDHEPTASGKDGWTAQEMAATARNTLYQLIALKGEAPNE